MKTYQSIEEFKSDCLKIPQGKILPNWLVSVKPRKKKHRFKAACDLWYKPLPNGEILLFLDGFLRLENIRNVDIQVGKYSTIFILFNGPDALNGINQMIKNDTTKHVTSNSIKG